MFMNKLPLTGAPFKAISLAHHYALGISALEHDTDFLNGANNSHVTVYRDILEEDVTINGDMGIVCTVQKVSIVLKSGDTKRVMVRQTDCFERRAGKWQLIHEHASVPSGGEWD